MPCARLQDELRPHQRMALPGTGSLSTPHQEGGGVAPIDLPGRHQRPAGKKGVVRVVQGSRQQRHGEPHLAQGEGRLGRMVQSQPGTGEHHAPVVGMAWWSRHGWINSHPHLGAGGHRCGAVMGRGFSWPPGTWQGSARTLGDSSLRIWMPVVHSKKPLIDCSASAACIRPCGKQCAPPTPSNSSTGNSLPLAQNPDPPPLC